MQKEKNYSNKVRRSYIISAISVALVLFLMGTVSYMFMAATHTAKDLRDSITMIVELKDNMDQEQRDALKKELLSKEHVISVEFCSKESKLEDEGFREMIQMNIEDTFEENPLLDSFDVKFMTSDDIDTDKIIEELYKNKGVDHVSYPKNVLMEMNSILRSLKFILILFGGALLGVSLILMFNTIRLAIYTRRYNINTMKLVGATRMFILKPFIKSAINQGLIAGVLSSILFMLMIYGIGSKIPEMTSAVTLIDIATILGVMVLFGIGFSVLFTIFAVNRFISMRSNKIHIY